MNHYSLLDHFLLSELSAFLLIFCRAGSAFLAMPGFSETYVSTRFRLLFALGLSIMITPLLASKMPMLPGNPLALFVLMFGEILVGVFLGLIVRTVLTVMHTAGNLIATHSALAVAASFDPTNANQSAVMGNLLGIAAITLMFALNLHHLMITAIVQSYDVFAPGLFPSTADMSHLDARMMADAFRLGVIFSGPHLAYSFLFYMAGGLMSRLMPNFQIFFVMMSLQILLALLLFVAILPTLMHVFSGFAENQLMGLVGGNL
jgi:flagellar biosynthetic protein FliR